MENYWKIFRNFIVEYYVIIIFDPGLTCNFSCEIKFLYIRMLDFEYLRVGTTTVGRYIIVIITFDEDDFSKNVYLYELFDSNRYI